LGDRAGARQLYYESLAKYRQIDDPWGMAAVLRDLGDLACRDNDPAGACTFYRQALTIFHKMGHRRGMALLLQRLAHCAVEKGHPDCAVTLAGAGEQLLEKLGISLSAIEREHLERTINSAREKLPPAEQEKSWSEGRAMSMDRLLEYALEGQPPPPA
jgi:hypothetical protein